MPSANTKNTGLSLPAIRLALLSSVLIIFSLFLPPWQGGTASAAPEGASVRVKVQVPDNLRSGVFSQDRFLNLPPNFSISVMARIPSARFLAYAPNGDLLVSQPSGGRIMLVQSQAGGGSQVGTFASGLRNPHDMVFHLIDGTMYLYVAESNQINRYVYTNGDTTARNREIVVRNLPDASTPELNGNYGHQLKNIALDSNHKLYVSIASTCNACLSDTRSNPVRGSIYQYDANGQNGRLFAQGIRNAEGLAFVPGTNDLWVAINNRDNIAVPDPASPNYKRVIPSYVDNHPPEAFTKVRDGGNYGWPFCNSNPDSPSGLDNMPYDRDVEFNADGSVDCGKMDRINKGIQAHTAPLGLTFLQDTAFAPDYKAGAVIALHGSWNRTSPTGYKVIYFPWDSARQQPGDQLDLVTGWLTGGSAWGRPVDVAVDPVGNMAISDDSSGTVYKLTYTRPPTSGNNGISNADFERIWQRTDQPVKNGTTSRSWLWGPAPFTGAVQESYSETSGGNRQVQYFDKSRMEINNPNGNRQDPFFVTNGLLVRELVSGRLQTGDNRFENRAPAGIGVAGDIDDTSGPTYQTLNGLTGPAGRKTGQITTTLDRSGKVGDNPADFARYNTRSVYFVPETGHNVASPFWDFLNQSGPVYDAAGQLVSARLFDPLFYATGFPISEAYWARVKVGGQVRDVLVQAFERRIMTFTPANPAGFQVEMGNVGRHYHLWRYGN
ncbi:MAG: L-sorbosone dehydrogenase [Chloroflexi bacterium]|nr:L-sorbosone dehydrogenase [Chloroflexota bacterium]